MTQDSTTQDLPELPVGLAEFSELRQGNCVYVDKTADFPELLKARKFIFCARPRRFGKSLTLSAFDEFCSGREELFRGLAAERYMRSPDFVAHPVIRLDMSVGAAGDSIADLSASVMVILGENAARHNVSLHGPNIALAFYNLLLDVNNSTGKQVVLLIDEYDAPVIDVIGSTKEIANPGLLSARRNAMQDFYLMIKSANKKIKMAFITGITKFTRMGVFSRLNNLTDISLSSKFSSFMGYTQEELETYFAPFITSTALELGMSNDKLLRKIRHYYNGFSFDGKQKLYNPYSINNFFYDRDFLNYWTESGSDSFIRKFLMDKAITADQFQDKHVNSKFVRAPGEIDATPAHGFLYQAGYLTLRKRGKKNYTLRFPNLEVREYFAKLFLQNITYESFDTDDVAKELSRYLASCDIPGMVDIFHRLFAGICHKDHREASRSPVVRLIKKIIRKFTGSDPLDESVLNDSADLVETLEKSKGESFYRSLLQACLWTAGAKVTPEKPENIGALDLETYYGRLTYVFELKMAKNARDANVAVRNGMKQIHEKGYGLASKDPIFVSLAFGKAEKNIVGCIFEKNGQETTVEIKRKAGNGGGS
ncbi:MAG: ATP-binding protein [Deltaproteobacteria bacterium]|jgi:hypothetical protein|nr:ATP-binding protein [Deltaproteobacteria bacterium]